jgi:hypothetical protein
MSLRKDPFMANQNSTDEDEESWVSAIEAVHLISRSVGGDKKAKSAIAERMFDGSIMPHALWMSEAANVGEPYLHRSLTYPEDWTQDRIKKWRNENAILMKIRMTAPFQSDEKTGSGYAYMVKVSPERKLFVSSGFWKLSEDPKRDQKLWDWGEGMVVVTKPPLGELNPSPRLMEAEFGRRFVAFGLHFKRSDILAIVEPSRDVSFSTPSPQPVKLRRAGKHDWEPVLLDLIAKGFLKQTDEDFGPFGMKAWQAKLEVWIKRHFESRGLSVSDSAVRNKVVEIRNTISNPFQ